MELVLIDCLKYQVCLKYCLTVLPLKFIFLKWSKITAVCKSKYNCAAQWFSSKFRLAQLRQSENISLTEVQYNHVCYHSFSFSVLLMYSLTVNYK